MQMVLAERNINEEYISDSFQNIGDRILRMSV